MAGPVDDVARALINQHMDDCGRRYATLDEKIDERFDANERLQSSRHFDNVRRLNVQERLLWTAVAAAIAGSATLIFTLIHNGGHL